MKNHYSILVQWSDEDNAYLVILPEFGPEPKTHGATYKQAIQHAQEVLELLTETYEANGWPMPEPRKHGTSVPA